MATTRLGPGGYPVARAGPAVVSVTVASTWQPSDAVSAAQRLGTTVASTWEPSDSASASLSLSAAFASTWLPHDAVSAALALSPASFASTWQPSDSAHVTATFSVAVASEWLPSDSVTVTVAPPPPQPGPQKLYPLRERTYRRRFLGVGYDPICVITKDRPGPIRIIEFIGEIKDE